MSLRPAIPLVSRVEGRIAQTLRFARRDGTIAVLHPVRFGTIYDTLDLKGWQVIKEGERLNVLVLAPVTDDVLKQVNLRTEQLLKELGIEGFAVNLRTVADIPRHGSGKIVLVKDESPSLQT